MHHIYPTCERFPLDFYDTADVNALLVQLSEKVKPLTRSRMFEIAKEDAKLFVARDHTRKRGDQKYSIVAMALFIPLVTGTVYFGLVEDVVTDERNFQGREDGYRRQGIGTMLTKRVIENGRMLDLAYLELHSSNKRQAAHAMYLKCGFKLVAQGEERSYFRYDYC